MLHTELERKLPQFLLERVDKMELIEFPNDTKCKLGFLDTLLRKWFCNPFTDDDKYFIIQKGYTVLLVLFLYSHSQTTIMHSLQKGRPCLLICIHISSQKYQKQWVLMEYSLGKGEQACLRPVQHGKSQRINLESFVLI